MECVQANEFFVFLIPIDIMIIVVHNNRAWTVCWDDLNAASVTNAANRIKWNGCATLGKFDWTCSFRYIRSGVWLGRWNVVPPFVFCATFTETGAHIATVRGTSWYAELSQSRRAVLTSEHFSFIFFMCIWATHCRCQRKIHFTGAMEIGHLSNYGHLKEHLEIYDSRTWGMRCCKRMTECIG